MGILDHLVSLFRPRPVLRPEMFRTVPNTDPDWRPSVGTMTVRDGRFQFLTPVGWVDAAELCRCAGVRRASVPVAEMVELARAHRGQVAP